MTRKKVYLIIQTVLCVLLVVLLSRAAIRIFQEGSEAVLKNPLAYVYTPEAVAREFAAIAPVLFVSIGMAAAGLVLGVKDDQSDKGVPDVRTRRDLIVGRISVPGERIRVEQAKQRKGKLMGWLAFGAFMVPVLLYVMNGAHFPERDLEGMIHSLATGVFPWIGAGIASLMAAGIWEEGSIRREIEAAKEQLAAQKASFAKETVSRGAVQEASSEHVTEESASSGVVHDTDSQDMKKEGAGAVRDAGKKTALLPAILIAAALVCLIAGIMNGSMQDVLVKAAAICTECVGLG